MFIGNVTGIENFSPNMFLDRNCASYCEIFRSAGMIAGDTTFLGNVHILIFYWAQWLMVADVVVNKGEAWEKSDSYGG